MTKTKLLPPTIYKYFRINENLYQLLINNKLWFSYHEDFNYPYDCYFDFSKNITVEASIDFLMENFENGETLPTDYDRDSEFVKRSPDLIRNQVIKPIQEFITSVSLCCFSANSKSLLMWSHYADSHGGVCIGFGTNLLLKTFTKIFWVKYKIKFPELNLLKMPIDSMYDILANKSNEWQYEKEVRILGDTKGNFPFMKEAVKEVIFGIRSTEEQRNTIVRLVNQCKYKVTLKKGVFSKENYEIKFVNFVIAYPVVKKG